MKCHTHKKDQHKHNIILIIQYIVESTEYVLCLQTLEEIYRME